MRIAKEILNRFPHLKYLLKSMYYRLQGMPPISYSIISDEFIRECVGKEDPTILEIGSNDGSQALRFLEIFKNPRIYCFEPDPRAISRFKAKVGSRSNISFFEIALSNHNGEIEFHQSGGHLNKEQLETMPNGWDLSGSIRQPKDHIIAHPWVKFDQIVKVSTSTLDTWCEQNGIGTIDFIWMDVQGAEIDVFKGGKKALRKTRFLYSEYNNRELYKGQLNLKQMIKFLNKFEVVIRYPNDILLKNKQPHQLHSIQ